ncbi:MAG: cytochrome P460 family protein [Chloroflexi bacterium]|nr:cytochrome P460 family protein [Chloroflexota bacterium]MDA1219059.1 cytochrome P460 family protein [Chloroflexota bacterium]PKB57514.1 MAG: hypothetical protein BZY73_02810 [SAR202 cluster bacterium Casp-Chloro-G3]
MTTWLKHYWKTLGIAVIIAVIGTACGAAATPTQAPAPAPQLPDTTGAAVWSYLQAENYQENWTLWPGMGELYPAKEPHGALLTTYLSSDALAALNAKAGVMPNGAIIVKENYMPDGILDATTVMFKVDGYNPDHADWFFTKIKADNTVEAEGKVPGCQACHSIEKDNDYIYTGELK